MVCRFILTINNKLHLLIHVTLCFCRCLSDHEDGDLFVVNDTDESETESGEARLKWDPAVKRDPYPLKEELHLSLQEVRDGDLLQAISYYYFAMYYNYFSNFQSITINFQSITSLSFLYIFQAIVIRGLNI